MQMYKVVFQVIKKWSYRGMEWAIFLLVLCCLIFTVYFFTSYFSDYLLHKEKQIPAQLLDRWRKAALAVSYASVFTTFVIGVSAFGKQTDGKLLLLYGAGVRAGEFPEKT